MKKFFNFLFHLLAAFGLLMGIFYLYQRYMPKVENDEEEFDDEFEDFDFDDKDFTESSSDNREYVTLNSSESKTLSEDDMDSDVDFDEISD